MQVSKREDLRLVLAGASNRGLALLRQGLKDGRVIRGLFVGEGDCNGCILFFLSEYQVRDRAALTQWVGDRWHVPGVDDACKRLIVGWDAADPSKITKGKGYEEFYPKASYVLNADEVIVAIDKVLADREPKPRCDVRRGGRVLLV